MAYKDVEERRRYAKEYARKRDPEKKYTAWMKYRYGISPEEYNGMFLQQKGCCAICGTHVSILKTKLHIDHDHKEGGSVRQLLCGQCNRGLGLFKDSPAILEKAAVYLRRHDIG